MNGTQSSRAERVADLAAAGADVHVCVPAASPADVEPAAAVGVSLVAPDPIPGVDGREILLAGPRIADDYEPDVIVGRARFYGPYAYSLQNSTFRRLRELAGDVMELAFRPYTADEQKVQADLRSAWLVIMPSRHEGFGLATGTRGELFATASCYPGGGWSSTGGTAMRRATVIVIGAGQAGLSAAYHLRRRAVEPFVVLDGETAPGGAWQHRWASLRMATVNGIFDLPGLPRPEVDPQEPSSTAVPRYFADYERAFELPIVRPVRVHAVRQTDAAPDSELLVETSAGDWLTRAVINATGTWGNPVRPAHPGGDSFLGRQLHTIDYVDAAEFAGQRVAIVGGGISAVQLLEEISRVATTFWYTRREPVFIDEFRSEHEGRATIAKVLADVEAGRPSGSIVSYTGLGWTDYARAAQRRGALRRRPMFTAIEPSGVREADGGHTGVDVILWATGFRAALGHLEPLGLRGSLGGIPMRGTQVAAEPRIHLVGYGPSQSTVGANRAGREAVAGLQRTVLRQVSRV